MRRYYDILVDFSVYTSPYDDEYTMAFSSDWKYHEMLDFMCDKFGIDEETIHEVRCTFIRRYKVTKDD